jgi:hypothetical protein
VQGSAEITVARTFEGGEGMADLRRWASEKPCRNRAVRTLAAAAIAQPRRASFAALAIGDVARCSMYAMAFVKIEGDLKHRLIAVGGVRSERLLSTSQIIRIV